jgi:hypothetical protein
VTLRSQQARSRREVGQRSKGYTTFTQTIGTPDFDMDNSLASWFVGRLQDQAELRDPARHDIIYTHGIEGSPLDVQPRHEQPAPRADSRDAQS